MAKAVKNSSKPEKGARGAADKGKSKGKAPARQGRMARAQSRPAAKGEKRGISRFVRDVRVEMGKVTWPTRQDLLQSTIVVLVAVAIAAAYVGVADFLFSQFVERVLNLIS